MHPTAEPVARASPDPNAQRLAELRRLFPEAFSDGRADFDKLKAALGEPVSLPERFLFTWAGRADALDVLRTPSRATLVPCPDESLAWDTTRHLFVEGDNLEVLKLLYKAYAGKVKLIYIDPPYNTGQDFVYPAAVAAIQNYANLGYGFCAPGVIISECLWTFCRMVTDGTLTAAEGAQAVRSFLAFMRAVETSPNGDHVLAPRSDSIRSGYGCGRTTDAIYIALAEAHATTGSPDLLTFDPGMQNQALRNAPTVTVRPL